MESLLDHYPVFEANQVLMSRHLNDAFDYLDQQERQTRSHLIGIGIVCGLQVKRAGNTVALSKGCGISSQGYLLVEPEDVELVACRAYTLPPDIDYPPFRNGDTPYAMWELFEDGVPNTTPLDSPAGFLDDKAVLLFLELKKEPLRNCSPNNCDDKGSQVVATVRRLLVARDDLDDIIAAANGLGSGLTGSDLAAALSLRLDLPDLRLRRFDVTRSDPATSNDLYAAFLDTVRTDKLAHATGNALSAAYAAFKPLLVADYPADPFAGFAADYGFLDEAPADAGQVRFLPYYMDFLADVVRAYDEFRWQGLDLMCACCPDDRLFPRHLMLGLLDPGPATQPDGYRHGFLPSPAVGGCEQSVARLRQLFARLVAMCESFTNQPSLPAADPSLPIDPQIRITPSRRCCGAQELEGEAIPYYYAQQGATPLYRLWSPTLTQRRRDNQNLGYHADLYEPAAPDFVTDPLRYALGSHDFLRIEGHLGKNYQQVMQSLLGLKSDYRLPIDVIALRTGAYDESQPVDLSGESARFQDLQALYASLRGALLSQLAEGTRQFYDRPIAAIKGLALGAGTPRLPLLQEHAPHYAYAANTIGAWYEHYLARFENQGYIDVDQNAIDANAVMYLYCALFNGTLVPEQGAHPDVVAIYYMSKLAGILPSTLEALDYPDFENKYQDLMALIRYFRSDAVEQVTPDLKNFLPQEEFIDRCEGILMGCRLDAVKAVHDAFTARVGELRRSQLLSSFLQREPGIEHRAGVPLGGTFIVVYHGEPARRKSIGGFSLQVALAEAARESVSAAAATKKSVSAAKTAKASVAATREAATAKVSAAETREAATARVLQAIGNLRADRSLSGNADVHLIVDWLGGQDVSSPGKGAQPSDDPASGVIDAAVGQLDVGTVIADFFLPYRLAGAGPGIEYVLPRLPPAFTATAGCSTANGALVTIEAKGGVPPYDVAVDGGAYQALTGPLQLAVGEHSLKLRDTAGTETTARKLTVAPPIALGEPSFACAEGQYTATATISGGVPPYRVDGKAAPDARVVTTPTASGTPVSVTVTDSRGCALTAQFNHECPPPCTLPCGGDALERNFRFFIPDPDTDPENAYQGLDVGEVVFIVEAEPGKQVDLSDEVARILTATKEQLSAAKFKATVDGWLAAINKLVASHPELAQAGKAQWLTLGYRPLSPGRPGLLSIDWFRCLDFDIRITAMVMLAQARLVLKVAYSPKGTTMQWGDQSVTMPAFDGTSTDKCADAPKPVNLCPVPPDFKVEIKGPATAKVGAGVEFAAVAPQGLEFVWEAQGGTPTLGNGAKFATAFATPGAHLLVLTGFNDKGCSATSTLPVKVEGSSPQQPSVDRGDGGLVVNRLRVDSSGGATRTGALDKVVEKAGTSRADKTTAKVETTRTKAAANKIKAGGKAKATKTTKTRKTKKAGSTRRKK
jgi:hypothetical protein